MDVNWKELQTRGFVVIRSFLSESEVEEVRRIYTNARRGETLYVSMVASAQDVKAVSAKCATLFPAIRAATDIRTDTMEEAGYFFPTEYTNLSWHTDHKSFYFVQNHYHYLNFWMPVIKPVANKSGLSVVPMDKLEKAAPDVYRAVYGAGAAAVKDGSLQYESDGRIKKIPCSTELVDSISESPDLVPGDIIVVRTDVLHKTQDSETIRVALTMRAMWSEQVVTKKTLLVGSPEKHQRMLAEPVIFRGLLACFWMKGRNQITLGECRDCFRRMRQREKRARLTAGAAALLFSTTLLPYRLRSMRRLSGSYVRAMVDLARFDIRYRRASRAMRKQGA